jgi:hypothetical protein
VPDERPRQYFLSAKRRHRSTYLALRLLLVIAFLVALGIAATAVLA